MQIFDLLIIVFSYFAFFLLLKLKLRNFFSNNAIVSGFIFS